jgi:hypothetical protein
MVRDARKRALLTMRMEYRFSCGSLWMSAMLA